MLLVELACSLVSLEGPEAQVRKSILRNIQQRKANLTALPRWEHVELVDPCIAKRYKANELLAAGPAPELAGRKSAFSEEPTVLRWSVEPGQSWQSLVESRTMDSGRSIHVFNRKSPQHL